MMTIRLELGLEHNTPAALYPFNLSMANSHLKQLPEAETAPDNASSIDSCRYQWYCCRLIQPGCHHAGSNDSDARYNNVDNPAAFSPDQSQSRKGSDPVALVGYCLSIARRKDATWVHVAEILFPRFRALADSLSIDGNETADRYQN